MLSDREACSVLLIGYGANAKDGKYWIARVSWGKRYGEKGTPSTAAVRMPTFQSGHLRIRRGINRCGIENVGSVPEEVEPA